MPQFGQVTVIPTASRFAAFECLETCLAECSQGRKINGRMGGPHLTSRCLPFVCSSLEAFGLLGTTKRGRGDREGALRTSTDKAKAERTSLQVNSEKQLAGSWGKLRFQTINHHSLLHNNKDVVYSTVFSTHSQSISYFLLKLLCRSIDSKSFG